MDESIIKQLEQDQAVKLSLSQAIRKGAKLRPQCKGWLFMYGGSCAMGAAFEGRTGKTLAHSDDLRTVSQILPELQNQEGILTMLGLELIRLNDYATLSREAIADILEARGL